MQANVHAEARPEAMGDVPGICEMPLEVDTPGGRIEDIGLALVVEGRYAATAEVLELGSGRVKVLDLSTELVVLDWVYEPTLDYVTELITASAASQDHEELRQYGFQLALRVLQRRGFGPLTRPTLLRVGYRDICRDLDLHEGTSIRMVLGPGRLTRAHLDYDTCALVFRTAFRQSDAALEHALRESFPSATLRRIEPRSVADSIEYHVRFPLPTTLAETRACLALMRRGLGAMLARFEPMRFASVERWMDTFGERETLAGLHIHEPAAYVVPIAPPFAGSLAVH